MTTVRSFRAVLLLLALAIVAAAQTVTLTVNVSPATPQDNVFLTAQIVPAAVSAPVTVTFLDNTTVIGTAIADSGGFAQIVHSNFTVGTHQLTATAPGYLPDAVSLVVLANLTVAPNPSTYCSPVTLTAVPPSFFEGAPVIFVDGLTTLGTVDLIGGIATLTTSTLTAGTHDLGAAVFSPFSTFATLVHTVNPLTPAVTLVTDPNPSALGQLVAMSATIGSCNATGTVTFREGTATLGTAQVANGTALFSTTGLSFGTHTITARYNGDANNNPSVSNTVIQVVGGAPTILFTTNPNPSTACQLVTLTATLVPPDIPSAASLLRRIPGPAVTGSVTFSDGNTTLGTATVSAGVATLQVTLLAGNHPLTARYNGDRNYNPVSALATQVVNTAAPSVTFTTTPNPSSVNQAVLMTATVTGCGTATGSITFLDGTTTLATVSPLTAGGASFTTSSLTVGTHPLSARYSGDVNNSSATSNTVNQVVGKIAATTTLAAAPNPSNFGQAVVLTATVTSTRAAPPVPAGSVLFLNGSTQVGSAPLNSSGVATVSVSTLPPGSNTLTALYVGDANFLSATSNTVNQVVGKIATTTTLAVTPNPSNFGQAVVLTATVASTRETSLVPTGSVQFFNGSTQLGSAPLNSGGVATLSVTNLPAGNNALSADYVGDANFLTSTSTVSVRVLNPTSLNFSATPNPATFGQVVTLTARLSPASVTGVVTFREGGTTLGVAGLSNGVATATVATLPVGTHTITANYPGDITTSGSSATLDLTVIKATTTTSLSASTLSVPPGGSVTLTAHVGPASASGTVTFVEGGETLGSSTVSDGIASLQATFTTVGTHIVTASYGGDAGHLASTSSPVTISVGLPVPKITVSASSVTPVFGQAVTLTAAVSPASATGSVAFTEGSVTLGTASLSGGSASISIPSLSVGTHTLTATYGGDANNAGNSGAVTVVVGRAPTTTSVGASPNPVTAGQPVTIMTTITPAAATGTVTFSDNGTTLGTATLANGSASMTTSALAAGQHSLGVAYGGDSNFLASSGSFTLTVNPPPPAPLQITSPASIPSGTVGQAYPAQTITATGGVLPYTWSLVASGTTTSDLTVANSGNNGSLSGTPGTAGNFTVTVQVRDSATPPSTDTRTYNVAFAFAPLPPITISSTQLTFGQGYPIPLTGTLTLTFAPNASNIPANFVNRQLLFQNGTNTAQVNIPANSTSPVTIPPFQQGSVAGTISVTLTAAVNAQTGQAVPLPDQAPAATITLARSAPVIDANSVRIINVSATGFQVTFNGTSNTRDLVRADVSFTAASGTELTGSQTFQADLSSAGNTWFSSGDGQNGGGTFSATIPFAFAGDANAIPTTVSVTVTNSAGTSASASGGR